MIFATHVPRPPLNQFIEMLWFHEGFNADHRLERVLPDGSMELIINLRDEKRHVFDPVNRQPRESYRRSWLSGPHSEFIVIDTAPDASMIGVHLRPGGASAFFGLPLSELRNRVVELDTLWNSEAQNLRDQLIEAPGAPAKFRILENALLARWRGFAPRHRAVRHALDSFTRLPDNITVGQVTADVGLSRRRLIEIFTEQIGMAPKVFCRVLRFQRAINRIQRRPTISWTDIAVDCGYYDQAHFIKNFREFCGMTPGEYAGAVSDYPNFVPIRE